MLSPLRDFSGTITAGGTSQKAIGQREYGRNCLIIQNPPTETDTLYVAFGDSPAVLGGGGGTLGLAPGATLQFSAPGFVPNNALQVIGATTGQKYTLLVGG